MLDMEYWVEHSSSKVDYKTQLKEMFRLHLAGEIVSMEMFGEHRQPGRRPQQAWRSQTTRLAWCTAWWRLSPDLSMIRDCLRDLAPSSRHIVGLMRSVQFD